MVTLQTTFHYTQQQEKTKQHFTLSLQIQFVQFSKTTELKYIY